MGIAMDSDSYRKGTELRAALMGSSLGPLDEKANSGIGMRRFSDFTRGVVFGNLWQREGIDIKLRTLLCVVTDVAMGFEEELSIHIGNVTFRDFARPADFRNYIFGIRVARSLL